MCIKYMIVEAEIQSFYLCVQKFGVSKLKTFVYFIFDRYSYFYSASKLIKSDSKGIYNVSKDLYF